MSLAEEVEKVFISSHERAMMEEREGLVDISIVLADIMKTLLARFNGIEEALRLVAAHLDSDEDSGIGSGGVEVFGTDPNA